MNNLTSSSINSNMQFYDNENYDDICENILNITKKYIQEYLKELNEIPKDLDKNLIKQLLNYKELFNLNKRRIKNLIEMMLEIL